MRRDEGEILDWFVLFHKWCILAALIHYFPWNTIHSIMILPIFVIFTIKNTLTHSLEALEKLVTHGSVDNIHWKQINESIY